MEQLLKEFNIDPLCFITDNCSNVMLASNELAEEYNALNEAKENPENESEIDDNEYACDEEFETLVKEAVDSFGCQCHLLELVVKDAVKASTVCLTLDFSLGY